MWGKETIPSTGMPHAHGLLKATSPRKNVQIYAKTLMWTATIHKKNHTMARKDNAESPHRV